MSAKMSASARLDKALVDRGLARSREEAVQLVEARSVRVNGAIAEKVTRQIRKGDALVVTNFSPRYVGRGAFKLLGAIEDIGLKLDKMVVCDLGSSTGGFTQVLIEAGAAHVLAVDVGKGQMSERVASNPRVKLLEGVNARTLTRELFQLPTLDLVVGDLSFISLSMLASTIVETLLERRGLFLLLVKPQFELDRATVSKGKGVVSDPVAWERAIESVVGSFVSLGATITAITASKLRGALGNQEFFIFGQIGLEADAPLDSEVADMISQAILFAAVHDTPLLLEE